MSIEPRGNIGLVRPRFPDPSYFGTPLSLLKGSFCKIAFEIGPKLKRRPTTNRNCERKENMWVLVKKVQGMKLIGPLNNDPLYAQCECDDIFEFYRHDILEVHVPTR